MKVSSGRVYVRTSEAEDGAPGHPACDRGLSAAATRRLGTPAHQTQLRSWSLRRRAAGRSSRRSRAICSPPGRHQLRSRRSSSTTASPQTTTRVSEPTGGGSAQQLLRPFTDYQDAMISANGRWVVFTSSGAAGLVPGDFTNYDVFLHDLQTGTTELVSHAFGGGFANGDPATIRRSPTTASGSASGATQAISCRRAPTRIAAPISSSSIADRHDRARVAALRRDAGCTVELFPAPVISGNGRFVLFATNEDGADPDDTNGSGDVRTCATSRPARPSSSVPQLRRSRQWRLRPITGGCRRTGVSSLHELQPSRHCWRAGQGHQRGHWMSFVSRYGCAA
mgnify:CR=1 FL=1